MVGLLGLPYELRYKIYQHCNPPHMLGGTHMIWICEALELRYNAWLDFRR